METQTTNPSSISGRASAKDFFINLGAIVALYTTVLNLINLLFRVINKAYPQINQSIYSFFGSESISWPVAAIIIFFPIFLLLMWLLARDYRVYPEKQNSGIHRWLTYITLFIAGLTIAIDLITVLYYFIDGQELTTGFLLKVAVLLVVVSGIFSYYLYDVLGKLTTRMRNFYRVLATLIILGSIVWGFSVLGSPRTQQLIKYDQHKVSDLQGIKNGIESYYADRGVLPETLDILTDRQDYYFGSIKDPQTQKPYEYVKTGDTAYQLCAVFNKQVKKDDVNKNSYDFSYPYGATWAHEVGRFCFDETINQNSDVKPIRP